MEKTYIVINAVGEVVLKIFMFYFLCLGWESLSSHESIFRNIKQSHSQYVPLVTWEKNGRETGKEWERKLNGLPHLKAHHVMSNRKYDRKYFLHIS